MSDSEILHEEEYLEIMGAYLKELYAPKPAGLVPYKYTPAPPAPPTPATITTGGRSFEFPDIRIG